jgi:hypothetical protein
MMEMAKHGKHDKTKKRVKEVYDTWPKTFMEGKSHRKKTK